MSGREFAALLALAAVWGASFLFMRVAAPELGPFLTVEIRVLLAAIVLIGYAAWKRHRVDYRTWWKQFLVIGALNAAIPFVLITTAELHISASLASILNATAPLFTALVAWVWLRESFGWRKLAGVLIGVLGVAILVGWSPGNVGEWLWLSASLSLLGALFYGIGGNYAVRAFRGVTPLDLAIGQQVGASLLLAPFALSTWPTELPSLAAVLSVIGLAVLSTALAYLLYYYLLHAVGAMKAVSVTFLIPVFGILWGVLFLQEALTWLTVLGTLVIFASVALVTDLVKRPKQS